jgi:hypothetical protein
MKRVHAALVLNPKDDEEAAREAKRKAQDIDQGKRLVAQQTSPGGFEQILLHDWGECEVFGQNGCQ